MEVCFGPKKGVSREDGLILLKELESVIKKRRRFRVCPFGSTASRNFISFMLVSVCSFHLWYFKVVYPCISINFEKPINERTL